MAVACPYFFLANIEVWAVAANERIVQFMPFNETQG